MKYILLLLLMVLSVAHAQDSGGSDAGTSKSDLAAQSIFDRLSREVASRSGTPQVDSAIGRAPLHITFLMDSSQNSAKDFLPVFEKKVVAGVLRRIGLAQAKAAIDPAQDDSVSVFPYQLRLIDDSAHILSDSVLQKGAGTVEKAIDKIPSQRIPVAGEGELGHDSSGARSEIISKLRSDGSDRQNIIIQMTPTSVNSDPSDPSLNAKMVRVDARAGALDGTGFVVYNDDGRYYQTDPPGQGVSASDVHVWIYGPSTIHLLPANSPQDLSNAAKPQADQSAASAPIALYAILAVAAVAVGYLVYRFMLKIPVEMDGEIAKAGFSRPVSIVVSGGKLGENCLQISPQLKGTVGDGLKVGQITVPLLFGGPRVSGGGGHTMFVSNSAAPEISLTRKARPLAFGKGSARTEAIPFKLR
jgi:hypothetical protein